MVIQKIVSILRYDYLTSVIQSSSLLSKIKSFFESDGNRSHTAGNTVIGGAATFRGPGGFYNQNANNLVVLKPHNEHNQVIKKEVTAQEDEASAPNSALASFFLEKGDKPLNDVEYEGVLSLIKKTRTGAPTSGHHDVSSNDDPPALLKSSSSGRDASFKTPSFLPKYDDFSLTAETSLKSVTSNSSKRARVFDYSSLPSPYRSGSYRHSAANVTATRESSKENDETMSHTRRPSTKLSNTACALISLLDDEDSKAPPSGLANPYSSRVSEFKKLRKSTDTYNNATTNTPSKGTNSSPIHSIALSEIQDNENNNTAQVETTAPQIFTKYKPAKASSLRTAVHVSDSPDKSGNLRNPEPQANNVPESSFDFSFQKPQPSLKEASDQDQPKYTSTEGTTGSTIDAAKPKPSNEIGSKSKIFNFGQSTNSGTPIKPGTEEKGKNRDSETLNANAFSYKQSSDRKPPIHFNFVAPPPSGLAHASCTEEQVQS